MELIKCDETQFRDYLSESADNRKKLFNDLKSRGMQANEWEYLKYTTHNWNEAHDKRLFAVNETEVNQLSMYLEQVYNNRLKSSSTYNPEDKNDVNKTELYKNYNNYYLIVTDDFNSIKNIPFITKVINTGIIL